MTQLYNSDLTLLVPKLKFTGSKSYAECASFRNIPPVARSLYTHQLRGARCSRTSTSMLLLHHPGQGKTRIMITALEARRNSYGPGSLAVVITKETIRGYTVDEIDRLMREKIPNYQERMGFYNFYTYSTFASNFSQCTDEFLTEYFAHASFAIDEVHTLISYIRARGDAHDSGYNMLVRMRRLLPDNLFIVLSATPMINYAWEIGYLATILLHPKDIVDLIDESTLIQHLGSGTCVQIAQRIVNTSPVLYKEEHVAKRARMGVLFNPSDIDALPLSTYAKELESYNVDVPKGYRVRQFLEMGDHQRREYIDTFSTTEVYRIARRSSISSTDLPSFIDMCMLQRRVPQVGEIANYSALFAHWLQIELDAFQQGHWGVGAWYLEVVDEGVGTFREILKLFGWVEWSTDISKTQSFCGTGYYPFQLKPEVRPRLMVLTSDENVTSAMRTALTEAENVRGTGVRSVIYSGSARDGINILNCLRSATHTAWSESGELQAESRHIRANSLYAFDAFLAKKDEEFLSRNRHYIREGLLFPMVYSAVSVPYLGRPRDEVEQCTVSQNRDFEQIGWPFSIDVYMLQVQCRKSDAISQVFDVLRTCSVDVQMGAVNDTNVEPVPVQFHGYASTWMMDDATRYFSQFSNGEIVDMTSDNILGPDDATRLSIVDRMFSISESGAVVGPRKRSGRFASGLGALGLSYAPTKTSIGTPQLGYTLLGNIFPHERNTDNIKAGLDQGLRTLGTYVVTHGTSNIDALLIVLGPDLTALLSIYSKLWCFTFQHNDMYIGVYDAKVAYVALSLEALLMCVPLATYRFTKISDGSVSVNMSSGNWYPRANDTQSLYHMVQMARQFGKLTLDYIFPKTGLARELVFNSQSGNTVSPYEMLASTTMQRAKILQNKRSMATFANIRFSDGFFYSGNIPVYLALAFPVHPDGTIYDFPDNLTADAVKRYYGWYRETLQHKLTRPWDFKI